MIQWSCGRNRADRAGRKVFKVNGGLTKHLLANCEPMERFSSTCWLQFCVFYGSECHMTSD